MDHDEITAQTMNAFDELLEDEEKPEPEEEVALVEEEDRDQEETPEEAEEEDGDEEEDGEDDGEEESEEEEAEVTAERDIDVVAFLAKYDGDIEKALKGAADLSHLINRQGREKNAALARAEELEGQLARLQAFSPPRIALTEEQRQWAEEAANSDNPAGYVQMAVDEGQFDLARAVCEQWAHEDPFNAPRLAGEVDAIEQQANAVVEQPAFELPRMLEAAREQYPDMPVYWGQMSRLVHQLGDDHRLVVAARSTDVHEAAEGIVGLYEYAKATSVNVREAKDKVKATRRQAGVDERQRARVTSASTSPAKAQTPQRTEIMPGLTLEDLEAELARTE